MVRNLLVTNQVRNLLTERPHSIIANLTFAIHVLPSILYRLIAYRPTELELPYKHIYANPIMVCNVVGTFCVINGKYGVLIKASPQCFKPV